MWVVALGRAWLLEGTRWITNVLYEPSAGAYETSPRIADKAGNLWFTTAGTSIARAGVDGSLTLLTAERRSAFRAVSCPLSRTAREASGPALSTPAWRGCASGILRCSPRGKQSRAPLVWAVVEDSTGAIWLGTEHSGLHRWQEGKFTQFDLGPGGLAGSVYSLCLDRQNVLWAGTGDKGVFRFENGKFLPVWEYRRSRLEQASVCHL